MTEKTQPTDAELMPCPFCEGRARMKTVASDWWKIIIDHAEGCVLSGHYDDAIVPQDDESKDWLIDRWNTRAKWGTPAPVGVEPVARLEIGKTQGGVSLTHIAEPAAFQLPEGMYALYTTPQPTQAQVGQLADEHIEDLLKRGNPTDEEKRLVRLGWDAARNAQEVQAQAGAVPLTLTDAQIDQAIADLGLNYLADAHATNRAVLQKLCRHAHGIKGGQ